MANKISMKNPGTGLVKDGFYGFSWTTLFFGGFPAFFRGDILIGVAVIILNFVTFYLAGVIWAFLYNKNYTSRLLEKGFIFEGSPEQITAAKASLGIA